MNRFSGMMKTIDLKETGWVWTGLIWLRTSGGLL
jgi:hypothetical protein